MDLNIIGSLLQSEHHRLRLKSTPWRGTVLACGGPDACLQWAWVRWTGRRRYVSMIDSLLSLVARVVYRQRVAIAVLVLVFAAA